MFTIPNKRLTNKTTWLKRLDLWLSTLSARLTWGLPYISSIYKSKIIYGWQVRFGLKSFNKSFTNTKYGGKKGSFKAAVSYRDTTLSNWINSF